jgi:hypothetical protein
LTLLRFTLALALLCASSIALADIIKLSRSNICHDASSPSYLQTKHFTAYHSLAACFDAGGRLPKNGKKNSPSKLEALQYNRKLFSHWSDDDKNCINTRHELLIKLSTSTITYKNSCNVDRGRWLDPYTDKTFYSAKDLDVDHMVPLKWAWDRGANMWSAAKRKRFANDKVNLFAVQASVNRQKGAMGPLEWLPPNERFHCQYVVRFIRATKMYDMQLRWAEAVAMNKLKVAKCGGLPVFWRHKAELHFLI